MNIAFLTSEYPHQEVNRSAGIGSSIYHLAHALVRLGHGVIVIAYGQDKEIEVNDGEVELHTLRNVKVKGLSWLLTRKKIQSYINQLVRQDRIDVIEAPDWTGITAFVSLKCPLILKLHGTDSYFCHLEGRQVKVKNKWLERLAFKRADAVVAVSGFTAEVTNQVFGTDRDIEVIHNGIDLPSTNHTHREEENCLLYFGTLIRKKGVLELPDIFNRIHQKIPNSRLFLAGSDASDIFTGAPSTWELMKARFSSTALDRVTYLGLIPPEQIPCLIGRSTLCLFPSYAEAFPVSWIEAMAMGKAIVSSNIGWSREVFEDGLEGLQFAPSDHDRFAAGIIELLLDPNKRAKLGAAARDRVQESLHIDIIAQKHLNLYQSICLAEHERT